MNRENKGQLTEKMLETTHEEYKLKKLAVVWSVPRAFTFCGKSHYEIWKDKNPAMVATTGDNRPLVRFQSDVDFIGTIQGGRSIKFDSKEVSKGVSIPLDQFKPHQVRSGLDNMKVGGIGGFIVHFIEKKRVFWIDAKTVDQMVFDAAIKRRNKSINIEEFTQEIPVEGYKIDWIRIFRAG
jgi:recombination protein U